MKRNFVLIAILSIVAAIALACFAGCFPSGDNSPESTPGTSVGTSVTASTEDTTSPGASADDSATVSADDSATTSTGEHDETVRITVKWNYDGAPDDLVIEYKAGDSLDFEMPAREDYHVVGLAFDAEGKNLITETTPLPTEDVTVYVIWDKDAYVPNEDAYYLLGTFSGIELWTPLSDYQALGSKEGYDAFSELPIAEGSVMKVCKGANGWLEWAESDVFDYDNDGNAVVKESGTYNVYVKEGKAYIEKPAVYATVTIKWGVDGWEDTEVTFVNGYAEDDPDIPEREDYTFVGVSYDEEGHKLYNQEPIYEDTVVYAQWQKKAPAYEADPNAYYLLGTYGEYTEQWAPTTDAQKLGASEEYAAYAEMTFAGGEKINVCKGGDTENGWTDWSGNAAFYNTDEWGNACIKAAGTYKIYVSDGKAYIEGMLVNGSEEFYDDTWTYWTEGAAVTLSEASISNGTITITYQGGTVSYCVQLFYTNTKLEKGKQYKLTCTIYASAPAKAAINNQQYELVAGKNEIEVTYMCETYTYYGSVDDFDMQLDATERPVTLKISDVKWEEDVSDNMPFGGEPVAQNDTYFYWNDRNWCGSNVTVETATYSDGVMTIEYSGVTTACWFGMQLFERNSSLTVGKRYTLTMKINASVAGYITVNRQTVAIKAGDNTVAVDYVESAADDYSSFRVQFGAYPDSIIEAGTFVFTDITWTESTYYLVGKIGGMDTYTHDDSRKLGESQGNRGALEGVSLKAGDKIAVANGAYGTMLYTWGESEDNAKYVEVLAGGYAKVKAEGTYNIYLNGEGFVYISKEGEPAQAANIELSVDSKYAPTGIFFVAKCAIDITSNDVVDTIKVNGAVITNMNNGVYTPGESYALRLMLPEYPADGKYVVECFKGDTLVACGEYQEEAPKVVTVTVNWGIAGVENTTITFTNGVSSGYTAPTREGYTLTAWQMIGADGGTTTLALDTVFEADATVYAVWTENTPVQPVAVTLAFNNAYNEFYMYFSAVSEYNIMNAAYVTYNGTRADWTLYTDEKDGHYAFRIMVRDITLDKYEFVWYNEKDQVVAYGTWEKPAYVIDQTAYYIVGSYNGHTNSWVPSSDEQKMGAKDGFVAYKENVTLKKGDLIKARLGSTDTWFDAFAVEGVLAVQTEGEGKGNGMVLADGTYNLCLKYIDGALYFTIDMGGEQPPQPQVYTVNLTEATPYGEFYFQFDGVTSDYDISQAAYVKVNGEQRFAENIKDGNGETFTFKAYVGNINLTEYVFEWYDATGKVVATATYTQQGEAPYTVDPNAYYLLGTYGNYTAQWTPSDDGQKLGASEKYEAYAKLTFKQGDTVKLWKSDWLSWEANENMTFDAATGDALITEAGEYEVYVLRNKAYIAKVAGTEPPAPEAETFEFATFRTYGEIWVCFTAKVKSDLSQVAIIVANGKETQGRAVVFGAPENGEYEIHVMYSEGYPTEYEVEFYNADGLKFAVGHYKDTPASTFTGDPDKYYLIGKIGGTECWDNVALDYVFGAGDGENTAVLLNATLHKGDKIKAAKGDGSLWYEWGTSADNDACFTKDNDGNAIIKEDGTYNVYLKGVLYIAKAQAEPTIVTVTVKWGIDGVEDTTITFTDGVASQYTVPEREGYTLKAWRVYEEDGFFYSDFALDTVPDKDVTVHAVWEEDVAHYEPEADSYYLLGAYGAHPEGTWSAYDNEALKMGTIEGFEAYGVYAFKAGDDMLMWHQITSYDTTNEWQWVMWKADECFELTGGFKDHATIKEDGRYYVYVYGDRAYITRNAPTLVKLTVNYNYGERPEVKEYMFFNGMVNGYEEPTREGYTFKGFSTDPAGNNPVSMTAPERDMYVYAQWEENAPVVEETTVTVDLNYEGAQSITLTYIDGVLQTEFTAPTREGYTLKGYALDEFGKEPVEFKNFYGKRYVYAIWVAEYTVKDGYYLLGTYGGYVLQWTAISDDMMLTTCQEEGVIAKMSGVYFNKGDLIKVCNVKENNWLNWASSYHASTDSDRNAIINDEGEYNVYVKYATSAAGTGETYIYAELEKVPATVTITIYWNYEGAPEPTTMTVVDGKYELPTPPTREGYTFVWYAFDENGKDMVPEDGSAPDKDMAVFAIWQPAAPAYTPDPNAYYLLGTYGNYQSVWAATDDGQKLATTENYAGYGKYTFNAGDAMKLWKNGEWLSFAGDGQLFTTDNDGNAVIRKYGQYEIFVDDGKAYIKGLLVSGEGGQFADVWTYWYVESADWNCGDAVTMTSATYADGRITLTYTGGSVNYAVQLFYVNTTLEKGKTYKMTCSIYTNTAINATINDKPYELKRGDNEIEVEYVCETYVDYRSIADFDAQFDCAKSRVMLGISDVTWTEVTPTSTFTGDPDKYYLIGKLGLNESWTNVNLNYVFGAGDDNNTAILTNASLKKGDVIKAAKGDGSVWYSWGRSDDNTACFDVDPEYGNAVIKADGKYNVYLTGDLLYMVKQDEVATVTIKWNFDDTPDTTVIYTNGVPAAYTVPTREGYTLKYWTVLGGDGSVATYPIDEPFKTDITVYATWEKNPEAPAWNGLIAIDVGEWFFTVGEGGNERAKLYIYVWYTDSKEDDVKYPGVELTEKDGKYYYQTDTTRTVAGVIIARVSPDGTTVWNKTADITDFDGGHVIVLTGYDANNGYYITYSLRENI